MGVVERSALALARLAGAASKQTIRVSIGNVVKKPREDVRGAAAAVGRAAVGLVLGGLTASAVGVGAVGARSGALDVGLGNGSG